MPARTRARTRIRIRVRTRLVALLSTILALAITALFSPAASAADEQIYGSGSSWSANAMNQWIADESAHGVPVNFNVSSSGQGRTDFSYYQVDFANSDIAFQGTDPLTGQADNNGSRAFAYIPIVAGGTALMYHLDQGNSQVTNLRLSGPTIAKIFTGQITMWNDPAITADMNGHALPAKRIQVVVESNGSGTTFQFTDWMTRQYPAIWGAYAGSAKATSYYPIHAANITAQDGDAQVSQTITSSGYDGAIGYVQYSYALNAHYPVANVENAAGYFTAPNPYNAAVALTQAKINTSNPNDPTTYLTQDLGNVYTNNDPRSYPLSSYSYSIIPIDPNDSRTNANRAQTFADFAYYFLCQGQDSMPQLGYSPLTINLVQDAFDQVAKYSHLPPSAIQNKNPTTCNNPTYYPQDPSINRLAQIDPAPPTCDKVGQGPCAFSNTANPLSNATTSGSNKNGGGSGGGGSGSTTATSDTAAAGDQGSGSAANLDSGASDSGSTSNGATATELAASRSQGVTTVFGVLSAIELLLVLLVPALVAKAITRRQRHDNGGN